MRLAWLAPLVGNMLNLVEYRYRTGADMDTESGDHEGAPMEMAEALEPLLADMGINLPDRDRHIIPVMEREAIPTGPDPRLGVLLARPDGTMAFGVGRGMVVEPGDESLCLIESPETDRYDRGWLLPGIFYWEQRH